MLRNEGLAGSMSCCVGMCCGESGSLGVRRMLRNEGLLHVSIIQSSSGSVLHSSLKLQFKTLSDLLRFINLMLWQHVVCYV